MSHRLSRITTKSGDQGTTTLATGAQVAKNSSEIHLLGDLDELIALIGVTKNHLQPPFSEHLEQVQNQLMDVCGQIALPNQILLSNTALEALEQLGAELNQYLPPLEEFIIPGNGLDSSYLHLCRTLARRAERTAVDYVNDLQTHTNDPKVTNLKQPSMQASTSSTSQQQDSLNSAFTQGEPGFLGVLLAYLNRLSDVLFILARTVDNQQQREEPQWQSNLTKKSHV